MNLLSKLNSYAMVLLTASVAVSSCVHILGLDETKGGKAVNKVCFDLVGLLKTLTGTGT